MNAISIRCPECNGPQDLKNVAKKEWECEFCNNTLKIEDNQIKAIKAQATDTPTTSSTVKTAPESPLFTAISVLYLLIVGAAIICSILKIVENQTVLVVIGLTVSTNLYIGMSGFAIVKSEQAPEPSDPTILAILAWLIVNIILMVVGFPVAILTRIIATFLYFFVGAIIGTILSGGTVAVEIKKVEEIGSIKK